MCCKIGQFWCNLGANKNCTMLGKQNLHWHNMVKFILLDASKVFDMVCMTVTQLLGRQMFRTPVCKQTHTTSTSLQNCVHNSSYTPADWSWVCTPQKQGCLNHKYTVTVVSLYIFCVFVFFMSCFSLAHLPHYTKCALIALCKDPSHSAGIIQSPLFYDGQIT